MYWSSLKSVVQAKGLALQYEPYPDHYRLVAWDGPTFYDAVIWLDAVPQGIVDGGYSQAENDEDLADFEASYKGSANQTIDPKPAMEPDRRMVVVNFPADEGSYMWLCGAGDDIENQVRGGGTRVVMEFADVTRTEPEVQTIDIQFMEWIQLHDGQLTVTVPSQWSIYDSWNWGIHMGATSVVPNATNEGNCNVVNEQGQPGQPDSYIIVPAAGDGAFDVDLAVATPVPAGGSGYWRYDYSTDVLEISDYPGQADYHLLVVDVEAYFMRNVTVPCHPAGNFDFDAYKAERIYPRWKLRLSVAKSSNGPGRLSGWVVVFREQNT